MRVVVISDLHSNRVALKAVLAAVDDLAPDAVVVAGDVINRGPHPRECLDEILDRRNRAGWHLIKGNHEDYVLMVDGQTADARPYMRDLLTHTQWTCEQIRDRLPRLREWPDQLTLPGPEGSELCFLHASRHGNRSGLYEDMAEDVLATMVAPSPAVTVVGHTHIPFVRRVGSALVVNAGAAGLPFDGDQRASFALVEWANGRWSARVIRTAYAVARAEQDFHSSGYLREGGPMVPVILQELRQARPRLGLWHRDFEASVASGKITLADSITRLLAGQGCA